MSRPTSRRAVVALACLAAALLAWFAIPQAAMAIVSPPKTLRPLTTGLIDTDVFESPSASVRTKWLQRADDAGTGLVRINVRWGIVAPSEPQSPTNPSDPVYARMANIDPAVQSAHAQGMDVLLTVYHAPRWAQGPNAPADVVEGSWKPDPEAFGDFGEMLARRYSGSYAGLPRVRYFEAWDEPNLSVYLTPQLQGGVPFSPTRYRELLNEFYTGVHKAQPDAKVIGGVTAPFGDDDPNNPQIPGVPRLHPMILLRELFCLNQSLQPLSCPVKPKLDILSAHPVNVITAPEIPAPNAGDIKLADFGKLQRLLRAAENAGNVVPAGRHPVWATELWWITKPPNPVGVSLATHAEWLQQGLYLLWKQGVRTAINWAIVDPPFDPNLPPQPQANSGLFLVNETPKPAYTAWQFPFVGDRRSKSRVFIWGKAPATGTLNIQRLRSGTWQTIKRLAVQNGQVFRTTLPISGAADLRATIGGFTSLTWHQD